MNLIYILLIFFNNSIWPWCTDIESSIESIFENPASGFEEKKMIVTGEVHLNSSSIEIMSSLIKSLNKNYGFSEIVFELGSAEGILINKYMDTGDSTYLKYCSYYPSSNYRKVWKDLYYYNKNLPNTKKLKFHGIDFERQNPSIHAIEILLKESKFCNDFKIELDSLKSFRKDHKIRELNPALEILYKKIYLKLAQNIYDKSSDSTIIRQLKLILSNQASPKRMNDRNKDMVKNFDRIYNKEKKYYFQMGGVHVRLERKFTFIRRLIDFYDHLDLNQIEVIPTRYNKAQTIIKGEEITITGGGNEFLVSGKESQFENYFGNQLEKGIYVLQVKDMPKKLSKMVHSGYNYMFYIKETKPLSWDRNL